MFNNPFLEDADERAATAWMMACGLWKFDDTVPKLPVLEHMAYASPLDILWYKCEPPTPDYMISPFHVKHHSLADWDITPRDFQTPGQGGPQEEE